MQSYEVALNKLYRYHKFFESS